MDLASVEPFPDLPSDVARYVFEVAAYDARCTAEPLTRISKVVRQWIDPILYHTIILRTVAQLVKFHQSITLRNEPQFFARSVKLLRLGDLKGGEFKTVAPIAMQPIFEKQMELVQTILNTCSGVRRLALWFPMDHPAVQRALTSCATSTRHFTHLSVLDVMPNSLFVRNHPKFLPASLTHLHLDTESIDPFGKCIPWVIFSEIPQLSHICLSGTIASMPIIQPDLVSSYVDSVAVLPRNVTTFVLLVNLSRSSDQSSYRIAPLHTVFNRLVVISGNSSALGRFPHLHCFPEDHTVESDWGTGSGMDIWDFADICLAKQNQRP